MADHGVDAISPQTVQRLLAHHTLEPWRHHLWPSPEVPRDAASVGRVREVCRSYTRESAADERVLCVGEETGLQPRTRRSPTLPPPPGRPVRVEHDSRRPGAWDLFAASDPRTGKGSAPTAGRKRQAEFIASLERLERGIPAESSEIHLVRDNLRMHTGTQLQAWLARHPRFGSHHPPVPCPWRDQVEPWFRIVRRKRLAVADFAGKAALAERLHAFVEGWNEQAHPFKWTTKSGAKTMAKCEMPMAKVA
jgi:hypothetical protein